MKRRPRVQTSGNILTAPLPWQRYAPLIFIVFSLVLFAYSIYKPGNLGGVRTTVADIAAPVVGIISKPIQNAASYTRMLTGLSRLQEENQRLMAENARLREWYQNAMSLKAENAALQKLLNISVPPQYHFVTARVVSDSGGGYVKTMLVTAGSSDGIKKGHTVLAGEGLIGRTTDVGYNTARILLITDINSRIPVLVEGAEGARDIRAVLAGDNTNLPVLKHLALDARLKEGARIITSGHGGMFPYGLPVGEVVRLESDRWAVRPYAKPADTTFVRIMNGTDPRLIEAGQ